ncbi:MAG TPA: RDD family protein [Terriglobia bacterium]|nr:RDD family protein [Terriglobia bacterium]
MNIEEHEMSGAIQAQCVECGANFAVEDMIRYARNYVCATCKPLFMQKLAEGVRVGASTLRYAGFWIRVLASFIDSIVYIIFFMSLFILAFGFDMMDESPEVAVIGAEMLLFFFAIAYEVILIGRFGRTLGKLICGIKVVTADGLPVSYPLALGRCFAKQLSQLILFIGYIMAAFDDEKRALHDRICDTRVILIR